MPGTITLTIDHTGNITTTGDYSYGIFVDALEDNEGTAQRTVTIDHSGNIITFGEDAYGLFADTAHAEVTILHDDGDILTFSHGIYLLSANNIGSATVTNTGFIRSSDQSGIFVSWSAEGYVEGVGISITQMGNIMAGADGIRFDDEDGSLDTNGHLTINNTGDIDADADGIYVKWTSDDGYNEGVGVTITQVGDITAGSDGIEVDISDGDATVNFTGTLVSGGSSPGLYVTGNSTREGNTLNLGNEYQDLHGNWASGAIIISKSNSAVDLSNGKKTLNVYNDVTVIGGSGSSDISLASGGGAAILNNYGTLTTPGEVWVDGGGTNTFNNNVGAVYNSGILVYLGSSGTFNNFGDLSPGGLEPREVILNEGTDEEQRYVAQRGIQTTEFRGNFVMQETGSFTVNIDADGNHDQLNHTTEGTVTLGGNGMVYVHAAGYDFDNPYDILISYTTIDGKFADVQDTAFVDHGLDYSGDAMTVFLTATRKHDTCSIASATSSNQRAIGCGVLTSLFDDVETLSTKDENLQTILQLETEDDVRDAFNSLSGEVHASLAGVLMEDSTLRNDAVMQRLHVLARNQGEVYGLATAFDPMQALMPNNWWFEARGSEVEHDAHTDAAIAGLEHTATGYLIGVDHSSDGWAIGVAFGQTQGDTDIDDRVSTADTETFSFGLYGSAALYIAHLNYGAFANWHSLGSVSV